MKRSASVPLTLAASAAVAACGGDRASEPLRCVEPGSARVVADSLCERSGSWGDEAQTQEAQTQRTGGGTYGGMSPFLWYFGGRMAAGYVTGGAYTPLAGRSYRAAGGGYSYSPGRSGVVRGGFGGTAAGRVGG